MNNNFNFDDQQTKNLNDPQVEHDKKIAEAIENAKNGTTANIIRSLDLSKLEDRDKLRELLSLWGGSPLGGIENQQILCSDNTPLLPFPKLGPRDTAENHLISSSGGGALKIDDSLRRYDSEKKILDKLMVLGHELVKIDLQLKSAFGVHADNKRHSSITEYKPNIFIENLANLAEMVSQSLNTSITARALYSITDLPIEVLEKHPNYAAIKEQMDAISDFFHTWNETFFRYFSHIIQDPNYTVAGPQNEYFLDDLNLREHVHIYKSTDEQLNFYKIVEENKFCPEIEEEAIFFTNAIKKYRALLEKYSGAIDFAQPKTPGTDSD